MIQNGKIRIQLDKYLHLGRGYQYDVDGDIKGVDGILAVAQIAQNRIISKSGTWFFDPKFGNAQLYDLLENGNPQLVDNQTMYSYIEAAIKPMLQDGRIEALIDVEIISRDNSTLEIEIKVKIGSQNVTIPYDITL